MNGEELVVSIFVSAVGVTLLIDTFKAEGLTMLFKPHALGMPCS